MTYPNLFRRYVATLLDLLVLWFGIYGITRLPVVGDSGWGTHSDWETPGEQGLRRITPDR